MIDGKNFLYLPFQVKMKIFLYKMKKLYSEIDLNIYYTPQPDLSTGLFGLCQLFTISGQMYYFTTVPNQYTFLKVLGIYKKYRSTFMILLREDGFYQVQKDNFTFTNIFKSFDDCKSFIESY